MNEAERAANGATFLDEHQPGWWERIVPRTIDVHCGNGCPLGQTLVTYPEGVYALGLGDEFGVPYSDARVEALGFALAERDTYSTTWELERMKLNVAWEQEVAARRLRQTSPALARTVERAYAKATR